LYVGFRVHRKIASLEKYSEFFRKDSVSGIEQGVGSIPEIFYNSKNNFGNLKKII